jgi:hypothetical protein
MDNQLKKYISSLSEEERILYKPLIDDAVRRDEAITVAVAEAKAQAELYEFHMERLRETTARFHAGMAQLNRKLSELVEISDRSAGKDGSATDMRYPRLVH